MIEKKMDNGFKLQLALRPSLRSRAVMQSRESVPDTVDEEGFTVSPLQRMDTFQTDQDKSLGMHTSMSMQSSKREDVWYSHEREKRPLYADRGLHQAVLSVSYSDHLC